MTTAGKRGSARRAAILEAALRVIAERGADAVTHRAVASEAGVPAASTTYYFDSKEALVAEALELVIERSTELVRRHADAPAAASPDELAHRLVALVDDQLSDASAPCAAQVELMLEAGRRPHLQPLAERWEAAYMEALTAMVSAAGMPAAASTTQILTDAMEGAVLRHLAQPEDDFLEGQLRPRLERLVHALA